MTERGRSHDDDLLLSRHLDDALTSDEAALLRRRLGEEPALARRLEELRRSDDAVRTAYGEIANEPLPARVTELLSTPVTKARPTIPWFSIPNAVSSALALAAGVVLAFLLLPRGAESQGPPGLVAGGGIAPEGSALHRILQTVASSETGSLGDGWFGTPRLTFVNQDGDPCRRLDLSNDRGGMATLACRRNGQWQMELITFKPGPGTGSGSGFRPAAAESPDRIEHAIDDLIDGAPLGRDAERFWIERAWEPEPD